MNQNTKQKRSAASWLAELAKGRYGEYALSVLTALLGVACSLIPYFIIIRLITALVDGTAELTYCLTLCAWMAGCWVLRYVLHSVSTFMGRYGSRHYAVTFIHPFTQIHCFVSRIVVVGQPSRRMCNLYVINSIVMQHF